MLGADQDVGEVDLARDVVQRFVGRLAQHLRGARIDREQLAAEAVAAEIDLGAGGQAAGVGGGADQGDALRREQGLGEGGHSGIPV